MSKLIRHNGQVFNLKHVRYAKKDNFNNLKVEGIYIRVIMDSLTAWLEFKDDAEREKFFVDNF